MEISHPGLNPEFAARVRAERAGVAYVVPPTRGKPAKPGRSTKDLFDAARQLLIETRRDRVAAAEALAEIRRERRESAEVLAEARAQALTIITEAELAARALVRHPTLPSVAAIQKEVAGRHGIPVQRLLGCNMARPLVAARDEAIALAHAARPDLSFPALGRLFRRDHSSIMSALKRYRSRNP